MDQEQSEWEQVFGRFVSQVHYNRSLTPPKNVEGLFTSGSRPGERFTKGFFIHRGAESVPLQSEDGHVDLLIMDQNYVVGLRRFKENGQVRLLSIRELKEVEEKMQY
ncbi:MAG: hypothetical protein K9K39_03250 [Desulfohalobiaceae bacterium]|nr:hypothetical protein [Desulfohalobiaceae bacterium]